MKLNFDDPRVARIFSIFLALGLFFFVNIENQNQFQSNNPTDGASIQGSEIIPNLPIEVNIDTDRYFVSGLPDSVTLRIQGGQAIIFQTVATQSFTITTPNLNELGEGTHTIDLQAEGLSDNILWNISPANITLTIEEKVVEDHTLDLEISDNISIAEGYEISEPTLSTEVIQLSGAASAMEQISKVVVKISSNEQNINSGFVMSATVLVLNENDEPLNVNATPNQIEINVPVVRTQKKVPIVLREGNGKVPGYEYEISLTERQDSSVIARGNPEVVEALENFPVVVGFDNLTESKVVTIPVTNYPEGIEEVNLESIDVLIEVNRSSSNTTITD